VLLYSGTGTADGINGDTILLGPPFVITDDELTRVVAVVGEAIDEAVATVQSSSAVEGVSHRDAVAGSTAGA
jgi:hypothetical protein